MTHVIKCYHDNVNLIETSVRWTVGRTLSPGETFDGPQGTLYMVQRTELRSGKHTALAVAVR